MLSTFSLLFLFSLFRHSSDYLSGKSCLDVYGGKPMVTTCESGKTHRRTCVLWRRRLITLRSNRMMMTIMEMEMWLEICWWMSPLFSTIVLFVVSQVWLLFLPWFMDFLCVLTAIHTLFYHQLQIGPVAVSFSDKCLICSPSSNFCLDGFDTLNVVAWYQRRVFRQVDCWDEWSIDVHKIQDGLSWLNGVVVRKQSRETFERKLFTR